MSIIKNLSLSSLSLVRKSSFKNIKITYLIVKIPLSQYFNKKTSKKCILSYVFLFFFLKQRIEKINLEVVALKAPSIDFLLCFIVLFSLFLEYSCLYKFIQHFPFETL